MSEKQQSIFDRIADFFSSDKKYYAVEWKLSVDGASRGNPGPAGAGIYLEKNGKPHIQRGFYLGKKTNNQAEYLALLIGLYMLSKEYKYDDRLTIISDSELLVKQINKEYRVKNSDLIPLYNLIFSYLKTTSFVCKHVLREYNQEADVLANQGIDSRTSLPLKFIDMLHSHDVFIL